MVEALVILLIASIGGSVFLGCLYKDECERYASVLTSLCQEQERCRRLEKKLEKVMKCLKDDPVEPVE